MRRFNVFGLKRSGQHAIIEWIANHFPSPVCLANNCLKWPPNHKLTHVYHVSPQVVSEMRERENAVKRELYAVPRIYTVEDPHRKHALRDLPLQGHTNVFIIRSFWNNVASRMRIADYHSAGWDARFPDWWMDLAQLHYDTCLGTDDAPEWFAMQDAWFISYDTWCVNPEGANSVRLRDVMRIALHLPSEHGEYADAESQKTAHKGYAGNVGSSFYQWGDRGDENRRYELSLKAEERFQKLVANERECKVVEKCRELNKEIFGWTLNKEGQRV